jgi:YcxB-like protein
MFAITYRKPMMIFLTIAGLLNLGFGAMLLAGVQVSNAEVGPYPPLVFGILLSILLPFSVYASAKKAFAGHVRLHETVNYTFTNEQLIVSGETFSAEFDWSKIFKIEELKLFFIIYQAPNAVNLIPKTNLSGQELNELRAILRGVTIAGVKKVG